MKHGFRAAVEDCNLAGWARLWGKALFAFSPGTLLTALEREATAVAEKANAAGGIFRASTSATALSQHCLCGERVPKTLGERTHRCPGCGLAGDRDAVSATLASFLDFTNPSDPRTAFVDFDRARKCDALTVLRTTLDWAAKGQQDAPSESTAHPASDRPSVGEPERTSGLLVMARRNAGTVPRTTPDEPGFRRTTPERTRSRTGLSQGGRKQSPPLRDNS